MDAAADIAIPPPLDVLATPRRGRSVRTIVLLSLPVAVAARTETSPAPLASPAVAAWLVAAVGSGTAAAWTWRVRSASGESVVTLAELGFAPIDALVAHRVFATSSSRYIRYETRN